MKKIIAVLSAVILLLNTTACGKDAQSLSSPGNGLSSGVLDLSGQWKQVNSNSKDTYQGAIISGDIIEIYYVSDNGDTRSLYWSGSFDAPADAGETYSWISKGNTEKMESSLLASQDDTKPFTYANHQITYSTSLMGTTTTIRLEKAVWAEGLEIDTGPEEEKITPPSRYESGFDPATNRTIDFGGITFSFPSYFDTRDEKSTDDYLLYYPERTDCRCSLVFRTEDTTISQADFDAGKSKEADYFIANIPAGNATDIRSESAMIAGLSGWKMAYKKHAETGEPTTVNACFIFNPNSGKVVFLILVYDYLDQTDLDYEGDFEKIMETAALTAPKQDISAPDSNRSAASQPQPESQEAPEQTPEPESQEKPEQTPEPDADTNIRPEFKEAMDSYERFFDHYCEFMQNYNESENPAALLADYAKFMAQYADMTRKFEAWEDEDLSNEELAYYLQVQNNVNQKLLAAMP